MKPLFCRRNTKNKNSVAYEPTPRPESVIINRKSRVPKKESCCLAW